MLLVPSFAAAATGGRVGGSLFSSFFDDDGGGDKSTSSSSSSSWSTHSSRYYYSPPSYHSPPSSTSRSPPSPPSDEDVSGFVFFLGFLLLLIIFLVNYYYCGPTAAEDERKHNISVVKFQVGLMGKAQSIQKELDRINEKANSSTAKGLSYVLTGSVDTICILYSQPFYGIFLHLWNLVSGSTTALLRNRDHCIASYSYIKGESVILEAEESFKRISMEEVAKFDEVTLANVNNFKTRSRSQSPNELYKEYIVVTILVATRAVVKLPTINGTGDLKKALLKLGAIPSSKLMAVEVLWTPQQENDTLTEKELLKGYPDLRGFYEEAYEEGPFEDQEIRQPFLRANDITAE